MLNAIMSSSGTAARPTSHLVLLGNYFPIEPMLYLHSLVHMDGSSSMVFFRSLVVPLNFCIFSWVNEYYEPECAYGTEQTLDKVSRLSLMRSSHGRRPRPRTHSHFYFLLLPTLPNSIRFHDRRDGRVDRRSIPNKQKQKSNLQNGSRCLPIALGLHGSSAARLVLFAASSAKDNDSTAGSAEYENYDLVLQISICHNDHVQHACLLQWQGTRS